MLRVDRRKKVCNDEAFWINTIVGYLIKTKKFVGISELTDI